MQERGRGGTSTLGRHRRLLRSRRERPRDCAAEQHDELAASQLIKLHSLLPAGDGLQDIELTANSTCDEGMNSRRFINRGATNAKSQSA